jgi:hypothetical protein
LIHIRHDSFPNDERNTEQLIFMLCQWSAYKIAGRIFMVKHPVAKYVKHLVLQIIFLFDTREKPMVSSNRNTIALWLPAGPANL